MDTKYLLSYKIAMVNLCDELSLSPDLYLMTYLMTLTCKMDLYIFSQLCRILQHIAILQHCIVS